VVGPNGAGKTLCAIERYVRPALARGVPVVSTCHIDHPLASVLTDYRDIPELYGCVLLLDEITSCFPSRESGKMPPQLGRKLDQLRKAKVRVIWTAPAWGRADKMLRQVTQEVVVCRGLIGTRPKDPHTGEVDQEGWRENHLFIWRAYPVQQVEEFSLTDVSESKGKKRTRKTWGQVYWRGEKSEAAKLYNSMEGVNLLSHLDDFGNCFDCGGRRDRPRCSCTKPTGAQAAEPPALADRVSARPNTRGTTVSEAKT